MLGRPDDLRDLVAELDVDRVDLRVLRPSATRISSRSCASSAEAGVQVEVVPRFFDVIGPGLDVHSIGGITVLGLRPFRLERSAQFLKRTVDIAVSGALLLLLAPVFAAIAVLIKLDSRGPVFFRQVRMGAGERTFRIWKFRTMTADADVCKRDVVHLNQHLGDGPAHVQGAERSTRSRASAATYGASASTSFPSSSTSSSAT